MLWAVGSFGKVVANTFGGIKVRNTSHENIKMANQGAGFSWGMSPEVGGGHQFLA